MTTYSATDGGDPAGTSGRALVVGEALIDIVTRDRTVEHVGGSPLNVAVGLARLGRGIDFLTEIGADAGGRTIADYVTASGAQVLSGSAGSARTSTASATIGPNGAAQYTFDVTWDISADPPVEPPLLLHTGSIAAVRDPGCRAVAALVEAYRSAATISVDPNVRPTLSPKREQVSQRIEWLVERSDVVKVSDEDLRWLYPARTPEQSARGWLKAGPALVAVSMGPQGTAGFCRDGEVRVAAHSVTVVDTVGAGDSLMAGLLDALWAMNLLGADRRARLAQIDRTALEQCLEWSAAAAALTVSRAGADLPDRAALEGSHGAWRQP